MNYHAPLEVQNNNLELLSNNYVYSASNPCPSTRAYARFYALGLGSRPFVFGDSLYHMNF